LPDPEEHLAVRQLKSEESIKDAIREARLAPGSFNQESKEKFPGWRGRRYRGQYHPRHDE